MAELIDKGALVNSLQNDINMTIEFMNNNGTDKYDGSFDRMFGQLNTLKSYKSIVSDMPTTTEAEIRAKVLEEVQAKFRSDYESMRTKGIEDCINWADWVDRIVAEQLKGE